MTARDRLVVTRTRAFPYSKGLMAQSLMACGIAPDRAYRVARIIEAELRRGDLRLVTTDELRERAFATLQREEGDEAVERFRRWSSLSRPERPPILLIGGAPGTGKSTIATEIAHRFGITRIVSTDVVRQVMRGVIAREVLPQIHTSSFDAAQAVPIETAEADRTIVGFLQQAETVRIGVRGVVARAVEERFPLVLEGVHLVPGVPLTEPEATALVVPFLMAVRDEETHQGHFYLRAAHTADRRPVERYLQAFGEIRRIQDFLLVAAERHGVPVVEASDLDRAVRMVMDLILAQTAAPVPAS